jgi:uncharacterized protein YjiS (DUF1127 family)
VRTLPRTALRALVRRWQAYRARRRRCAEIALLRGLPDCELKDIGLSRFDIEALARARPDTMTREKERAKITV